VFWIGYVASAVLGADVAAMRGATGPSVIIVACIFAGSWTFLGMAIEVARRRR
jgi:hypothetical protein